MPRRSKKYKWLVWIGAFLGVVALFAAIEYCLLSRDKNKESPSGNEQVTNISEESSESPADEDNNQSEMPIQNSTPTNTQATNGTVNPDSSTDTATDGTTNYQNLTGGNFDER
jgi:cytoskeletal protein RodZ